MCYGAIYCRINVAVADDFFQMTRQQMLVALIIDKRVTLKKSDFSCRISLVDYKIVAHCATKLLIPYELTTRSGLFFRLFMLFCQSARNHYRGVDEYESAREDESKPVAPCAVRVKHEKCRHTEKYRRPYLDAVKTLHTKHVAVIAVHDPSYEGNQRARRENPAVHLYAVAEQRHQHTRCNQYHSCRYNPGEYLFIFLTHDVALFYYVHILVFALHVVLFPYDTLHGLTVGVEIVILLAIILHRVTVCLDFAFQLFDTLVIFH